MFQNRVAVVTGGAKGIGRAIAEEFRRAGAHVCIIDLLPNGYFVEKCIRDRLHTPEQMALLRAWESGAC